MPPAGRVEQAGPARVTISPSTVKEKDTPSFSRIAEEMIGDFRGIPFREPSRMRKRPTRDLDDLMHELLAKYRVGQHSPEDSIREKWAEIVGGPNAAYSHPYLIDPKSRLIIQVSHAMVRSNLSMDQTRILAAVQALPGCANVKQLLFRTS
jgi:hypothetical protein